jgi:hypothetical protein
MKYIGDNSNGRWSAKTYSDLWSPSNVTSVREKVFDMEKEEVAETELQFVVVDDVPEQYKKLFLEWLDDKKFQVIRETKILKGVVINDIFTNGALLEDWMNWLKWKLKEVKKKPTPKGRKI